jgi:hypothetical protein
MFVGALSDGDVLPIGHWLRWEELWRRDFSKRSSTQATGRRSILLYIIVG